MFKKICLLKIHKKTEFWREGIVFINDRIQNSRTKIFYLQGAKIEDNYRYKLKTGEIKEEIILDEDRKFRSLKDLLRGKEGYKITDFEANIVRGALDKFEFYKFKT